MGNDKEVRTPPRGIEDALFSEMAKGLFHAPAKREQDHRQGQPEGIARTQHDVNFSGGIELRFPQHLESADDELKRALAHLARQKGDKEKEETRSVKQKNDSFVARVCFGASAAAGILAYVFAHLGR